MIAFDCPLVCFEILVGLQGVSGELNRNTWQPRGVGELKVAAEVTQKIKVRYMYQIVFFNELFKVNQTQVPVVRRTLISTGYRL